MSVEHYVDGRRVYTLAQASDLLHVAEATLRKRVQYHRIEAAAWINPRLPVYHLTDLELRERNAVNITTDRDARDYVIAAIEAGDARRDEFDIEAICDELRALAGGWDFAEIEHDTFWAIVAKHAH